MRTIKFRAQYQDKILPMYVLCFDDSGLGIERVAVVDLGHNDAGIELADLKLMPYGEIVSDSRENSGLADKEDIIREHPP